MQISRGAASAAALASVLAAGLMTATPALATKGEPPPKAGSDYVFDFTGTCSDCDGVGTGVLTLTGVTDLSALTTSNFVDFSYSSNKVGDIDITDISAFSGDFSDLSQVSVDIEGSTAGVVGCPDKGCPTAKDPTSWVFVTSTTLDGPSWSLALDDGKGGGPTKADFGAAYSWTGGAVPEPASWVLMIAGFGLAGARLRSDRRRFARAV